MTASPAPRVASVDVYRGFVMFLMMAEVLSFSRVSEALPQSSFWAFLAFQQSHVAWVGCSLHDLIQPSFSFLVGVALPYSIASRMAKEQAFGALFRHALKRSLILIVLGIFLRSMGQLQTNFTFEDTLTQIGLGYPFLFWLGFRSPKTQLNTLALILVFYWLAFVLYPLPTAAFDYARASISPTWQHNLTGFAAHWNKNTNLAWAFDGWFLNLFPRSSVFTNNEGGYATLSFVPTLATMILGLWAGNQLKSNATVARQKLDKFAKVGAGLIMLGLLLNWAGICPNVKRIWTPTWVVFSGGCCFILLAVFYWLVDVKNQQKAFFWLTVVGANSIAAYVLAHTTNEFIVGSFQTHFGVNFDRILGEVYAPIVSGSSILLVQWLILRWLYRQRIFIKI